MPPAPKLSAYVGKYPSDKVSGISLYKHPKFRALVSAAAPSAAMRATILKSGVETPIELQGPLIVAQMCEPHNCSDHQWTVAVLSPNGPAAVCYHDRTLMGDDARWFVKGESIGRTAGCWQGEHTKVPRAVLLRLSQRL
jgi:hypothetical protein